MIEIEKKVKEIISEKLSIDINEIKLESVINSDFGADSLDIVELFMSMEDVFSINVNDEDVEKLITVKDVVEYIKSKS